LEQTDKEQKQKLRLKIGENNEGQFIRHHVVLTIGLGGEENGHCCDERLA